jgi:outer membrane protein TolC
LAVTLGGCAAVTTMTRPEGAGGWPPERRARELAARAAAAGVAPEPRTVPAPVATAPLHLADALARAAVGNRRLAEARQQLAIARQRVWEVRGRLLPAAAGQGRYTWYSDALTNTLPAIAGLPVTARAFEVRDQDLGQVNGTVTLPLDVTGELRHALGAAQAGYRGEAARLWATKLDQDVLVIGAYFTLLEAERLQDVTRQSIAVQQQQRANARDRFERGRLTKNELLVVEVGLLNAEQELVQRRLAIDQARWTLNMLIGVPIDAPTEVADVRTRPDLPAVEEVLAVAHAENPALMALLEEQQRLEATATSLARGRLPRFAGGGAVDYSTTDILDPATIGSGFVGFEWDLGTDGRREARIAEARIAVERNRTRLEREIREIERAVRSTHRRTEERLAALQAAEAGVGQAEENLRIRQQQFTVGRATSEDVLDAEALLAGQRATLASALYQAQTRRAELQQLMGRPLEALLADRR